MKLTVPTAIAQRAVVADPGTLAFWADREAKPVISQLREFANQITRERVEQETGGAGAAAILWESDELPDDCTWTVFARATAAGSGGYGSYGLILTARSVGGVVSALSTTTLWEHDLGSMSAVLNVDPTARTAILTVNDGGLSAMQWVAVVEVMEALVE